MSTRWYPLFQKGNPQLRVFLPNFWMKLVNPKKKIPPNQVQFIVSTEMTSIDVKNYLEKIYQVPVLNVSTFIRQGSFKTAHGQGYVVKDEDYKVAIVTLPKDQPFAYPNLFPKEKKDKEMSDAQKQIDNVKTDFEKATQRFKNDKDTPGWFA